MTIQTMTETQSMVWEGWLWCPWGSRGVFLAHSVQPHWPSCYSLKPPSILRTFHWLFLLLKKESPHLPVWLIPSNITYLGRPSLIPLFVWLFVFLQCLGSNPEPWACSASRSTTEQHSAPSTATGTAACLLSAWALLPDHPALCLFFFP